MSAYGRACYVGGDDGNLLPNVVLTFSERECWVGSWVMESYGAYDLWVWPCFVSTVWRARDWR